jgi:hypothetical protein
MALVAQPHQGSEHSTSPSGLPCHRDPARWVGAEDGQVRRDDVIDRRRIRVFGREAVVDRDQVRRHRRCEAR